MTENRENMTAVLIGIVLLTSFAYIVADTKQKSESHSNPPSSSLVEQLGKVSKDMTVKPLIVMHSRDSCPPCKVWINNDKSRWEKVGWTVEVQNETGSRFTPWFSITDGDGTHFEVDGLLTADSFKKAKDGAK